MRSRTPSSTAHRLPLHGSTIYATQYPCPRCVQSIIQVGIKRVVYLDKKAHQERINGASEKMLADAGVEIESLQELATRISRLVS